MLEIIPVLQSFHIYKTMRTPYTLGKLAMKLEDVLKLLRENSPKLKRLGVISLALFGSTARNEATPSSDVDILVDFNSPPTFDQYMETRFFLEDILGRKVDLVTLDGLRPLIRTEVEKEAVYVA
jgi:predicted nucleotidyltransferase